MLCSLPYAYEVDLMLKGHRTFTTFPFGAWMEVEIADVASTDAPVSMRWTQDAHGEAIEREARWFDGDNWQPAISGWPNPPGKEFTPEDFRRMGPLERGALLSEGRDTLLAAYARATRQSYVSLRRHVGSATQLVSLEETDTSRIRKIGTSNRQKMEDRIVRAANDMLFIDGRLWVRGKEPCYTVVRHKPREGIVSVYGSAADMPTEANPETMDMFRADRFDDARDLAFDLIGEAAGMPDRIEVLIPEAVLFRDEEDALRRNADHIVEKTYPDVRRAPEDFVLAWLALRESVAKRKTDMDAAMDCLKRMSGFLPEDSFLRAAANRMIKRWNLRPLEAEFPTP